MKNFLRRLYCQVPSLFLGVKLDLFLISYFSFQELQHSTALVGPLSNSTKKVTKTKEIKQYILDVQVNSGMHLHLFTINLKQANLSKLYRDGTIYAPGHKVAFQFSLSGPQHSIQITQPLLPHTLSLDHISHWACFAASLGIFAWVGYVLELSTLAQRLLSLLLSLTLTTRERPRRKCEPQVEEVSLSLI